ncbi:MAG: hypothetical protein SOH72_01275 [Bifidobacterium thermacidophilum]
MPDTQAHERDIERRRHQGTTPKHPSTHTPTPMGTLRGASVEM